MSDQAPFNLDNDHNVYIVGAGFSADAGLPVVKQFMNRMRDAAGWLQRESEREKEIEAIAKVLAFRLEAASAAYRVPLNVDDIEVLFSLAAASGDPSLDPAMQLAIAATIDLAEREGQNRQGWQPMIEVLDTQNWSRPNRWSQPPGVGSFVVPHHHLYLGIIGQYLTESRPDRRDTIITFNYDTVAEEALHDLGVSFHYGFPDEAVDYDSSAFCAKQSINDPATVQVLKLHGSVNWTVAIDEQPVPALVGSDLLRVRSPSRVRVFGRYENVRVAAEVPLLVPPTWRKLFTGQLLYVWDAAVRALRDATNLIILGYSLPKTDLHFKYLLAAGLRQNISLRRVFFVNSEPDDSEFSELKNRLFDVFRPEMEKIVVEVRRELISQFFTSGWFAIGRNLKARFTLR